MSHYSTLFVNDTIVSYESQRGISRYFNKMMQGVIASFGRRVVLYSRQFGACEAATVVRPLQFRGRRRLHNLLASATAFHHHAKAYYSPYFGSIHTSAAEVYTVYDMIYESFPHYFPQRQYEHRRLMKEKEQCVARATVLFAISANTARDVVACYPQVDPSKIVVTPLGVDPFFFDTAERHPLAGARPFLLFVGQRSLYKNFQRLLIAFGQSGLAKHFDLRVVSPTDGGFSPQEVACIERYRLQSSVRLLTAVSDLQLRKNYAAAFLYVCPSEYEGFGLPVLEAMASGTLVATSDVSSLPEVAGDTAFYFDPRSSDSIADCLLAVTRLDHQQRADRIARGIARARTFTWERSQRIAVDVFRNLL